MIVAISYDAIVEEPCRESPWGYIETFRPDISDWLDERLPEDAWDYEFVDNGVLVRIDDESVGLLFKLTFGGNK